MSKNKILDRPRSEAAHWELSRFSRLPSPGLYAAVDDAVISSISQQFSSQMENAELDGSNPSDHWELLMNF